VGYFFWVDRGGRRGRVGGGALAAELFLHKTRCCSQEEIEVPYRGWTKWDGHGHHELKTWNCSVLVIDNWKFVVADKRFITGFRKQGKRGKA
jgi:hypothetical protein